MIPFIIIILFFIIIITTSIDIHCSGTYSKIKSHEKSYRIFDFKSRDSTFYKAIEKTWRCFEYASHLYD